METAKTQIHLIERNKSINVSGRIARDNYYPGMTFLVPG